MREQQPDAALDAARPPGDRIEPAWVRVLGRMCYWSG